MKYFWQKILYANSKLLYVPICTLCKFVFLKWGKVQYIKERWFFTQKYFIKYVLSRNVLLLIVLYVIEQEWEYLILVCKSMAIIRKKIVVNVFDIMHNDERKCNWSFVISISIQIIRQMSKKLKQGRTFSFTGRWSFLKENTMLCLWYWIFPNLKNDDF